MAKSPAGALYECSECGWHTMKWAGRCGECQGWGTVAEAAVPLLSRARVRAPMRAGALAAPGLAAIPISQVDATAAAARPTGLDELDRVLGGGLGPRAVLLLAGEPSGGKAHLPLGGGAAGAG